MATNFNRADAIIAAISVNKVSRETGEVYHAMDLVKVIDVNTDSMIGIIDNKQFKLERMWSLLGRRIPAEDLPTILRRAECTLDYCDVAKGEKFAPYPSAPEDQYQIASKDMVYVFIRSISVTRNIDTLKQYPIYKVNDIPALADNSDFNNIPVPTVEPVIEPVIERVSHPTK
jgi:hypothetical protein